MNNTTDISEGGFLSGSNSGGFGYGIGVCVGILLLITTITLASYFCTKGTQPQPQSATNLPHHRSQNDVVLELGLDEATISSYPKLLYSELDKLQHDQKKDMSSSASTCCSICLADYKSSDVLRLLPDCQHLFHSKCVDLWLRLNATCPVCRTSPIPTPLSTPLAEVVPLVTRRD